MRKIFPKFILILLSILGYSSCEKTDIPDEKNGRIYGVISGYEQNEPISGVSVALYKIDSVKTDSPKSLLQRTTTSADGYYEFIIDEDGYYEISTFYLGYAIEEVRVYISETSSSRRVDIQIKETENRIIVRTLDAIRANADTIILNGYCEYSGYENEPIIVGFVYDTYPYLLEETSTMITAYKGERSENSLFFSRKTHIEQNNNSWGTSYYIRAFAKDKTGLIIWGEIITFDNF